MITLLTGERQRGESNRAIQACNDWLRQGPGRNLVALLEQYRQSEENQAPTRSRATLWGWSSRYGWAGRAAAYDQALDDAKTARAQEVMASGLALAHERVVELKELAAFLKGQLYEQGRDGVYHNVWLPDVKQVGSGKDAERVDLERFNAALIEQYRATLDDLARETGGRKQEHQVDLTQHLDLEAWKQARRERLAAAQGEEELACGPADA